MENNSKIFEIDRGILKTNRKLKKSNFPLLSSKKKIDRLKTDEELSLSTPKRVKYFQNTNIKICTNSNFKNTNAEDISKCRNNEQLEIKMNSGSKEKPCLNYNPGLNVTNVIPFNPSDMINSTCLTDFSALSHSENVSDLSSCTGLPGSSSSMKLSCAPTLCSSFNKGVSNNIDPNIKKKHLFNDTVRSNDFHVPIKKSEDNSKINEDIKLLSIEEWNAVKDLFKTMTLENSNKDPQIEDIKYFIKKFNVVNPVIIYNIRLYEHHKKMNILAKQISICTDYVQLLDECKELKPIPRFENELPIFTKKKRLNYFKDLSKMEYNVGTDDWNKIIVELSGVFSDHIGFQIDDEDGKNVLSNVAIEYIKKLAVMKKNSNIQLGSPPNSIDDSILNRQQIGVESRMNDLIAHYKNYVFDRCNKLYKKCVYLQRIIDNYIKRMSLNTKVINTNAAEEDTEKEKCTELKNSFLNTEIGQTRHVNINTGDETVENIKPNVMDSSISKPIIVDKNAYCKPKSTAFDIGSFKYLDAIEHLREGELFYDSESNHEPKENLTLFNEFETNKRKPLSHLLEIKKNDNILLKFYKILHDFNNDFIHYNICAIKNNVLLNSTVLMQTDEDYTGQPKRNQKELVHEHFPEDENNIYDISAMNTNDLLEFLCYV